MFQAVLFSLLCSEFSIHFGLKAQYFSVCPRVRAEQSRDLRLCSCCQLGLWSLTFPKSSGQTKPCPCMGGGGTWSGQLPTATALALLEGSSPGSPWPPVSGYVSLADVQGKETVGSEGFLFLLLMGQQQGFLLNSLGLPSQ